MDANSTFFNDLDQPTRQDPATGAFSSPDVTIVHASFPDRYDWQPLDSLSSNHRPILIAFHLFTEKQRGAGVLIWDLKKGDLATSATAVNEQLRGSGLTHGKSLTQMCRSFLQSRARCYTTTHRTVGSWDDRRFQENARNRDSGERTR